MKELSDQQRKVLAVIVEWTREHGYPPTFREIGARMRIKSANGVRDHLDALERKGWIKRTPAEARSIVVLAGATELERRRHQLRAELAIIEGRLKESSNAAA